MALSNIFNEPRRELIETVVGLAIVVIPLSLDIAAAYALTIYFSHPSDTSFALNFMLVAVVLQIVILGMFGVLLLIHDIGEGVCNALDRRGIRLRPGDSDD